MTLGEEINRQKNLIGPASDTKPLNFEIQPDQEEVPFLKQIFQQSLPNSKVIAGLEKLPDMTFISAPGCGWVRLMFFHLCRPGASWCD
jgi:hypothetical protein